jgi:hypothetical protein
MVLGIPSDLPSVEAIRSNWEYLLDQRVSLACFTEVDGKPEKLVAFNFIYVKNIRDEEEDVNNVSVLGPSANSLVHTYLACIQYRQCLLPTSIIRPFFSK